MRASGAVPRKFLLLPSRRPQRVPARKLAETGDAVRWRPRTAPARRCRHRRLARSCHARRGHGSSLTREGAHARDLGDEAAQRVVGPAVDRRGRDADQTRRCRSPTTRHGERGAGAAPAARSVCRSSRSRRSRDTLRAPVPGRRRSRTVSPPHTSHGSPSRCSSFAPNIVQRVAPHSKHLTASASRPALRAGASECNVSRRRDDKYRPAA